MRGERERTVLEGMHFYRKMGHSILSTGVSFKLKQGLLVWFMFSVNVNVNQTLKKCNHDL